MSGRGRPKKYVITREEFLEKYTRFDFLKKLTPNIIHEMNVELIHMKLADRVFVVRIIFNSSRNYFNIDPEFYERIIFNKSYSKTQEALKVNPNIVLQYLSRAYEIQSGQPYTPPASYFASSVDSPFNTRPPSPNKDDDIQTLLEERSRMLNRLLRDQQIEQQHLVNKGLIPQPVIPIQPDNVVVDPNVVQKVSLRPLNRVRFDLREFDIPANQFWIFLDNNYEYYLPISI